MKAEPLASLGFIALVDWAFRRFLDGSKDTEFRIHGGRFVAKHYPVGRLVVISSGYGRTTRALTRVRSFDVLDAPPDPEQWAKVYGTWKLWTGRKVAAIGLDVLGRILPAAPMSSICDCTTLVADELPGSDALRRAYAKARAGGFTNLRTTLDADDPDPRIFGGFVKLDHGVVTLEHDGPRRGPWFLQGLPGPPSRMGAAFLASPPPPSPASLPATFEETAAQLGKASGFPPNPSPGSPQALPEK